MDLFQLYKNCCLCPRECGINRSESQGRARFGFCGETDQLRVGYVGPHFGEEPPITGERGSGTVFFSGCSLKCSFCQNNQISHQGMGVAMGVERLFQELDHMIRLHHVHNINLVTPDHFFPHVICLISLLRENGFALPVIFNLSGYQSLEMLKVAEDYVDIYLPDFKYSDSLLATGLSKCRDYPQVALEAIAEMVRQKGFFNNALLPGSNLARKGVLVRHLILPGNIENSINALTSLFVEFGPGLPLSLMSQYHPVRPHRENGLNRFISHEEFTSVYSHAQELGFESLFVQFPREDASPQPEISPFLPDFRRAKPFRCA
jgi:putative pyruvate formate lyase activating enzyme